MHNLDAIKLSGTDAQGRRGIAAGLPSHEGFPPERNHNEPLVRSVPGDAIRSRQRVALQGDIHLVIGSDAKDLIGADMLGTLRAKPDRGIRHVQRSVWSGGNIIEKDRSGNLNGDDGRGGGRAWGGALALGRAPPRVRPRGRAPRGALPLFRNTFPSPTPPAP